MSLGPSFAKHLFLMRLRNARDLFTLIALSIFLATACSKDKSNDQNQGNQGPGLPGVTPIDDSIPGPPMPSLSLTLGENKKPVVLLGDHEIRSLTYVNQLLYVATDKEIYRMASAEIQNSFSAKSISKLPLENFLSSSTTINCIAGTVKTEHPILWVGTNKGITFIRFMEEDEIDSQNSEDNDGKKESPKFGLATSNITTVLPDGSGGVWIGTDEGTNHGVLKDGKLFIKLLSNRTLGETESVTSLIQDQKGFLWVGTKQDGLLRLESVEGDAGDQKNLVTAGTLGDDFEWLVNSQIYMTASHDKDMIWFLTTDGLHRIQKTKESYKISTYLENILSTVEDVSSSVDTKESLWIGTDRGLIRVMDIAGDKITPKTHVTKVENGLPSNEILSLATTPDKETLFVGTSKGFVKGAVRYKIEESSQK